MIDALVMFGFVFAAFAIYFLPYILAQAKKHPQSDAILLVNFLFGWTVLGWGIALIWAAIRQQPVKDA